MACTEQIPIETPEDACLRARTVMRMAVKKVYELLCGDTDSDRDDLVAELVYLVDHADTEIGTVYDLLTGIESNA